MVVVDIDVYKGYLKIDWFENGKQQWAEIFFKFDDETEKKKIERQETRAVKRIIDMARVKCCIPPAAPVHYQMGIVRNTEVVERKAVG